MLGFDDLLPEEQANPAITHELRTAYRLRPAEQQALARVHERLAQSSHTIPPLNAVRVNDLTPSRQRISPAELPVRTTSFRRRWLTRLNTLVAAILVIILVGSLALTLSLVHHTSIGSPAGNDIRVLLEPVKGSHPLQADMQAAREILLQRFSSFGLNGASANAVTLNGHPAIQVELPHFGGNEKQTIATLVQTGNLEFWCTGPARASNWYDIRPGALCAVQSRRQPTLHRQRPRSQPDLC